MYESRTRARYLSDLDAKESRKELYCLDFLER